MKTNTLGGYINYHCYFVASAYIAIMGTPPDPAVTHTDPIITGNSAREGVKLLPKSLKPFTIHLSTYVTHMYSDYNMIEVKI